MKNITIVGILGIFLIGCTGSQISVTASAPKGQDLDISVKTTGKIQKQ